MKNIYLFATVILLILLYFFGVDKSSSQNMEWKTFKLNTKTLFSLILIYIVTLYIIYRK